MFKKKSFIAVVIVFVFLFLPNITQAQSRRPAVVMSPNATVEVGATKDLTLSLVNMGVALRRAEITVRISGEYDQNWGLTFNKLNTEQYGLKYESHYFSNFAGRPDIQDLTIVFIATDPQGYNQGSAQIALATIGYKAKAGTVVATIIPEKSKITDNQGNLLPSIDTFGSTNYQAISATSLAQNTQNLNNLSSYSLSFNTDPIRMWWPTAPNSVQQIDAGIWKDSDGTNVQNFTNVNAVWQVDSNYIEITDTSSSYSANCASVQMAGNRPCIHFAAHAKTKKTGTTYVSLTVTDQITGSVVTNSYPLEIFSINNALPSPTEVNVSGSGSTPAPSPNFIPENRVSTQEFEEVQQKVTYLQSQIDQQQNELNETQSLLRRIYTFLKQLFRFN